MFIWLVHEGKVIGHIEPYKPEHPGLWDANVYAWGFCCSTLLLHMEQLKIAFKGVEFIFSE